LGAPNPPLGPLQNLDARVVRHASIKPLQRLLPLALQAGTKGIGLEGLVEGLGGEGALVGKVGGQIIRGIAGALCTGYPDFLAAYALPQGLQRMHLIVEAVPPWLA